MNIIVMLMKAAIFEKPGLENLKINHDVELSKITDHDVLIRVKMAGVNPVDHITVSGTREIKPDHILEYILP
jgi:NADPH:quinone reductase-like Zn-dependent oxidoreductase